MGVGRRVRKAVQPKSKHLAYVANRMRRTPFAMPSGPSTNVEVRLGLPCCCPVRLVGIAVRERLAPA